ncbi:MAG: Wzz/FepE/Etk N-terminal domain-containing protein [Bacteroidota bacterium]|nr:Wzz/FepE/Etk N-terminal domain-containing protein [Bacteroidota bacterium]
MSGKKDYSADLNSTNLVGFLYEKKKVLIVVAISAIVLSAIVSFLIPEKYKATVILFPSSTSSISKALLADNQSGSKNDIMRFGEEEDAEQLLQILNSDEIRNKIIEKYDLVRHYKIDADGAYKNTELINKYQDNISFKRTEFMSVKIEVLDENPQIAANIANDITALLDTVKNRMQKIRAVQGFNIVANEYQNIINEINAKEDSLNALRNYGVIDYVSQSDAYGEQYAIALSKGNKEGIKALEEKLKILADFGGAYMSITENLEHDRKQLRLVKTKYEEAKVDAEQNITHAFIVNHAFPAEKKSYPVRWLIVVISTLSALLGAVLLIILFDSIKTVKVK